MVAEVEVVGVEAVEVMTKGVVGVNKGVVVKDVVFVSALIVMVRIIQ